MTFEEKTKGSIEAGKLADLVIVNEDPLQDIRNLQKIDTVVFNGKPIERGPHAWYADPFLSDIEYAPVDSWLWVVALKQATFREGPGSGGPALDPIESPQPAIETISPTVVTEGSPSLSLSLKGFNFVRRTRVYFDGRSVPFRRVSPTELQVTLDPALLRAPGKFDIVVKNPEPVANPSWGNGTSNTAYLLVNYKY